MRPLLMKVAARRCVSGADPEDVVQEALARGAEYRELDLARLRQFLVATVMRLCADEIRRINTVSRLAGHPRLLPLAMADPAERACERAEARALAARLAALAPRDRQLVAMLSAGFSRKEIARMLQMSPQNTYLALHRVRRKISRAPSESRAAR